MHDTMVQCMRQWSSAGGNGSMEDAMVQCRRQWSNAGDNRSQWTQEVSGLLHQAGYGITLSLQRIM